MIIDNEFYDFDIDAYISDDCIDEMYEQWLDMITIGNSEFSDDDLEPIPF